MKATTKAKKSEAEGDPGDCRSVGFRSVPLLRRIKPATPRVWKRVRAYSQQVRLDPSPQEHAFYYAGDQQLAQWIRDAIERLGAPTRALLASHLKTSHRPRRLCTVCSGTDSPALVYKALRQATNDIFNWEHTFSCDIDPIVRQFLVTATPTFQHLFKSSREITCEQLALDVAACLDGSDEGGKLVGIPDSDDLVAGFPCQDCSNLQVKRMQNRTVVCDGAKRTGSVFHDLLKIAAARKVTSIVLENVTGLGAPSRTDGHSNLDYVFKFLELNGWWGKCFRLDPRMCGMPVSRHRFWILAVKMSELAAAGINRDEADTLTTDFMDCLLSANDGVLPVRDLDDFLLPDDNPIIRGYLANLVHERQAASSSPMSRGSWLGKTAAYVESAQLKRQRNGQPVGPDWWAPVYPTDDVLEMFPGLLDLTDRELSLLAAHGVSVTSCDALRKRAKQTINTTQGCERASSSRDGESTIVTPRGNVFLQHRVRKAHGLEALLLQGLHYGPSQHRLVDTFASADLHRLAGNAFNGYCCAAVVLARECLLAVVAQRTRERHQNQPARPIAHAPTSFRGQYRKGRSMAELFGDEIEIDSDA